MTAIDTNVLVRFLVRDDERQAKAVYVRLKKAETVREQLFIPLPVVLETIWVLESAYGQSRDEIVGAFEDLKQMTVFRFDRDAVVGRFLDAARKSPIELSDLLIATCAQEAGCDLCLTFDKKAARHAPFQLLA
jgi:predicted nucleic-acid-binding protein